MLTHSGQSTYLFYHRNPLTISMMYHSVWQNAFSTNWKWSRDERRCVCSHSMSFPAAATCHYLCLAIFGSREVHLVNVECEITIQSASFRCKHFIYPPRHTLPWFDVCRAACGAQSARKHASVCMLLQFKRGAERCCHKSLIILLKSRPWMMSVSHIASVSPSLSPQIDLLAS